MKKILETKENIFLFIKTNCRNSLVTVMLFSALLFTSQIVKAELPEQYLISPLQNPYTNTYIRAYEINDQDFVVGGYYLENEDWVGGGILWNGNEILSIGPVGGPIYDHINNKGDVADSRHNVAFINSQFYEFLPYGSIESFEIMDLNDNGVVVLDKVYTDNKEKRCSPSLFDGYKGEYLGIPYFNDRDYSFYSLGINNDNIIVGASKY